MTRERRALLIIAILSFVLGLGLARQLQRRRGDERVVVLSSAQSEALRRVTERAEAFLEYLRLVGDPATDRLLRTVTRDKPLTLRHTDERAGYTDNKGDVIAVCVRDAADAPELAEDDAYINRLFYVVLHELAHVNVSSWGHGPEFWASFELLRRHALDAEILRELRLRGTSTPTICDEALVN